LSSPLQDSLVRGQERRAAPDCGYDDELIGGIGVKIRERRRFGSRYAIERDFDDSLAQHVIAPCGGRSRKPKSILSHKRCDFPEADRGYQHASVSYEFLASPLCDRPKTFAP